MTKQNGEVRASVVSLDEKISTKRRPRFFYVNFDILQSPRVARANNMSWFPDNVSSIAPLVAP